MFWTLSTYKNFIRHRRRNYPRCNQKDTLQNQQNRKNFHPNHHMYSTKILYMWWFGKSSLLISSKGERVFKIQIFIFHFKLNNSGDIKLNTLKLSRSNKESIFLQIKILKIDKNILVYIKNVL